jgi:integrase
MSGEVREWRNGVGKRYQPDGSYRMVIRWRDRDGRQSTVTLGPGYNRKTAQQERQERIREANRGVAPGSMTLADFIPLWDASIDGRLRPQTVHGYRSLARNHLQPGFGRMRLREIRPSAVQDWLDRGPGAQLSPAMQRKVVGCLSVVLKAAAVRDLAEPVVLDAVTLRRSARHEMRLISLQELDALVDSLDPWYRPDVVWLAFTGLRRGEHSALLASDVDLTARTAYIHRTLNRFGRFEEETKTSRSRRTVDLFDRAAQAVHEKREQRIQHGIRSELLWTTRSGTPMSWPNFHRDHWKPATKAVGLGGLRLHDLRHLAASLMISAGLELVYVSRQLGHANVTTTMNVYAHLLEDRRPVMVDRFDQAYTPRA